MTEPIDSDELVSLYAEVSNGVSQSQSRFRAWPYFSEIWDRALAEVEPIRAAGSRVDLPS